MAGVSTSSRAAERQSRTRHVSSHIRWCQELGSELGTGSKREMDMMIREHMFVCIKFEPYNDEQWQPCHDHQP
jgi:hypothetical protein